jgi:predicted aconitase with swiveling domain
MPIDFSGYVNLTSFDEEPADIYLAALDYARLSLPELTIRQGTPEDAILQATSYISSLSLAAINRLPDRVMLGLLNILGAPRNEGVYPIIELEFTSITYDGTTIPAGLLVRYDMNGLDNAQSMYFQVVDSAVIDAIDGTGNPDLPTAIVQARCTEIITLPDITPGIPMSIESVSSDLYQPTLYSIVEYGELQETDYEYLSRSASYLGSLSSAFGKATQIDAYVLSDFLAVNRVKTYDLTDHQGDLAFDAADVPGHLTVFVYGQGAAVSSELKYEILVGIADRAVAGLTIGVLDAEITSIQIDVEVIYNASYDPSILEENIKSIVSAMTSPAAVPFDTKLRKSYLYSVIRNIPGVVATESVILTALDANSSANIDGDLEYAQKGVLPVAYTDNINVTLTVVN